MAAEKKQKGSTPLPSEADVGGWRRDQPPPYDAALGFQIAAEESAKLQQRYGLLLPNEVGTFRYVLRKLGPTVGRALHDRVFPLYQQERDAWLREQEQRAQERELARLGKPPDDVEAFLKRRARALEIEARSRYDKLIKESGMQCRIVKKSGTASEWKPPEFDLETPLPAPRFHRGVLPGWSQALLGAVREVARDWHLTRAGEPVAWWWDQAESALHDWAIGCPGETWMVFSRSIAQPKSRKYQHTGGTRVAEDKLERNVRWFVRRHIEGKKFKTIADDEDDLKGCEQAVVQMAYAKLCKILRIDQRS